LLACFLFLLNEVVEEYIQRQQHPPMPSNQLVLAILSTVLGLLCCCGLNLPFGIVAIVFASQVNGKYSAGDFQGALSAAKQAKIWGWISMGLVITSLVLNILYFVFVLLVAGAESYSLEGEAPFYDPPQYEYDPYD
jgi:hypothetical protein